MAQYNGFKCDRCGNVVDAEERTKQTVKYDGPHVEGEFSLDLCPACVVVPEGVDLKPLRRRRKKAPKRAEATPMDDSSTESVDTGSSLT